MGTGDWYPSSQAALIPWHDNFTTQAAINGTTLGLTAPQVTQIGADADNVLIMLNGMEAANAYREALFFNAPCYSRPSNASRPLRGTL